MNILFVFGPCVCDKLVFKKKIPSRLDDMMTGIVSQFWCRLMVHYSQSSNCLFFHYLGLLDNWQKCGRRFEFNFHATAGWHCMHDTLYKNPNKVSFSKIETCGQTMLPDSSILTRQKLHGKCQNGKNQMRHFEWFLNNVHDIRISHEKRW